MFEVIEVGGAKAVKTNAATNHVYLVDVSGSMYGSLPGMRQHLKNIVSMITEPDDTFSIIYFSGRGQCGVVCEGVPVKDIASVTSVQKAIDRWLTPIGLTGFAEPIQLAMDLVAQLPSEKFNNFVMLTDGYDNQSNRKQVVEDSAKLPQFFSSCSFIEYGWYCDRDLLAKMAEASGGVHVFAEGYEDYKDKFSDTITGAVRVPQIEVKVNKKAKHAIYLDNNKIHIVEPVDGVVSVPESVDRVHSIVPKDVLQKQLSEDHLYLIMYYAVKVSNSKLVWRCLEALGDVFLIDQYNNAFSKQELSDFEAKVEQAVLDTEVRFFKGKDLDYLPPEDAPTLMDVLRYLDLNEVKIVTDSPLFRYSRTTRATEKKETLPRFVSNPGENAMMTGLVYNSNRPNVSVQTLVHGQVEVPENDHGLKFVPSKQFRNYTIIRDGIINVKALPVVVDNDTYHGLESLGGKLVEDVAINSEADSNFVVLNLDTMPIVNRKEVNHVNLQDFIEAVYAKTTISASLKGMKACLPESNTRKSAGLVDTYGKDAAEWLSSIGVRDYGFSPKVASKEATDAYMSTEVQYKFKGLSSVPSAKAVQKKIDEKKKLNVGDLLVKLGMDACNGASEEHIEEAVKIADQTLKAINADISRMIYAMVIGKTWFEGEEDYTIERDVQFGNPESELNQKVKMTIDLVQKEVKI